MGLFLLLSAIGLAIWTSISRLQERVRRLESELVESRALASRLDALSARVATLDAGTVGAGVGVSIAAPASTVAPTGEVATEPPALRDLPPELEPETDRFSPQEREPVADSEGAEGERLGLAVQTAAATEAVTEPHVHEVAEVAPPAAVPRTPVAAAADTTSDTWELIVGTSWLNKIGVLIFVTGLALLLGYSMTHVGPAGRVFIGFLISGAMLATGVAFERRPPYRPFGLGLVGGGWAGAYVTAFAMHAVPAARVIESDVVGLLALLAVAGGMVAHSLKYRSEAATSLAYAAAFLPVAITPLTTFSFVATLPLVMSLLAVAQRFGWSTLSMLGLVTTYGLFVLRGRVLPGDPLDGTTLLPYALLGTYWLTFEAADILGTRRGRLDSHTPAPLFAANAAGYLGAFVAVVRADASTLTATVLVVMAAAYLGSAVVRARIGVVPSAVDDTPAFTTRHAALWLSAALTAWSIDLRMDGPRETLLLLIEAELFVVAALSLGDRQIRRIGMALAGLVSVHAVAGVIASPDAVSVWNLAAWTPTLGLVALTWYVNAEWLRRRGLALEPGEHLYTWTASAFVGLIIAQEFGDAYKGLAGLSLALVLSEVGRRQRAEYSWQSRVGLLLSVPAVLGAFPPDEGVSREGWFVLAAAAMLGYLYAWRHTASTSRADATAARGAAAVALCAGTAFVGLVEWHAVTDIRVLALWAFTGVILAGLGARLTQPVLRWQSYGLSALAAVPAVVGLLFDMRMDAEAITSVLTVAASLFVSGYVGRRAATSGVERFAAGAVALAGTAALTLFKWRVLPREALAPAWVAEGLVLVWLGSMRKRVGQRWQGYAATLLAVLYVSYWSNQTMVEARASGISPSWLVLVVALGVVIAGYGVSALARVRRRADGENRFGTVVQLEAVPFVGLPALVTYVLVAFELQWFDVLLHPFVVGVTASALLAAGFVTGAVDVRVQGYLTFAVSGLLTSFAIVTPARPTSLLWTSASLALFFAASLASRQPLARVLGNREAERHSAEHVARIALAVLGVLLTTQLIALEVRPSLVTMGWGMEGTVLLFAGFALRERALRLSGLALLFLCILKLFLYDLRELEALARILSFVALGLVLLGVSWAYTKYREEIRKLL